MSKEDYLEDAIKSIEDYFFGTGEDCGEKLFMNFAKEHKEAFSKAKLSGSTENNFEFYTDLFEKFQVIYEKKLEELIAKNKMTVEEFYEALQKKCEEGDQEIILFVDIINEIINYTSFIEMMANLINKV